MSMDRKQLHDTFERLLDAIDAEASAKVDKSMSNTDREAAQVKVIDLMHELQKDTGLLDLLQRRVVVQMRDMDAGAPVNAAALPAAQKDYEGEAGERRLRQLLRRIVFDCGILPTPVAAYIGGKTRYPSQGYAMGGGLGPLSEPVPHPGRNSRDGIRGAIADLLVVSAGYTAGYEGRPLTKRLSADIVERAQARARHEWTKRGYEPKPGYVPTRATLRKWTSDVLNKEYEMSYRRGAADHAAGAEADKVCLLPKLTG